MVYEMQFHDRLDDVVEHHSSRSVGAVSVRCVDSGGAQENLTERKQMCQTSAAEGYEVKSKSVAPSFHSNSISNG